MSSDLRIDGKRSENNMKTEGKDQKCQYSKSEEKKSISETCNKTQNVAYK